MNNIYKLALSQWRQANENTSCYAITPKLIAGMKLTDEESELVKAIDSSFETATDFNEEVVLYRVTHSNFISITSTNAYPSFLSTSMQVGEALRFAKDHAPNAILLKIHLKQNQKALKVSDSNINTQEMHEYLLPRNLKFNAKKQRFRISQKKQSCYYTRKMSRFRIAIQLRSAITNTNWRIAV